MRVCVRVVVGVSGIDVAVGSTMRVRVGVKDNVCDGSGVALGVGVKVATAVAELHAAELTTVAMRIRSCAVRIIRF